MAPAFLDLEAPNGVKYSQPTGLFINNEFVESVNGGTITSIDPAYVLTLLMFLLRACMLENLTPIITGPRSQSQQFKPLVPKMLTGQ